MGSPARNAAREGAGLQLLSSRDPRSWQGEGGWRWNRIRTDQTREDVGECHTMSREDRFR